MYYGIGLGMVDKVSATPIQETLSNDKSSETQNRYVSSDINTPSLFYSRKKQMDYASSVFSQASQMFDRYESMLLKEDGNTLDVSQPVSSEGEKVTCSQKQASGKTKKELRQELKKTIQNKECFASGKGSPTSKQGSSTHTNVPFNQSLTSY